MKIISEILRHPANRDDQLAALVRAVKWQIEKRITKRPFDLPYHGLKLRCYPDSHSASRAIYFGGLPDYREMKFMIDYLRAGDRFIDAGANVGLYTILGASLVGPSGHVDAFEPQESVAKILLESVALNGLTNVIVHQLGLSDVGGEAYFDKTLDDCTAHISNSSSSRYRTKIGVCRLDEQLANVPYAMAKFDIEGFEPFAIRGASNWIHSGNLPVMLVEMAGYSKRHGISTNDLITELEGLGYFTAVYCPERRCLHRTVKPWEIPVDNVLAISVNHEAFVAQRLIA